MNDRPVTESEYGGAGVLPNTLYPEPSVDNLSNGELLRLISITGQEATTNAEPDPFFWQGGERPAPTPRPRRPGIPSEEQRYRVRRSSH